ncbi:MAG: hypothetical protein V2A76_09800 [Planctomycetota bacterium]
MRIPRISPRRLIRPIRIVALLAVLLLLWHGLSGITVIAVPAGEPVLFDYPGGSRLLVRLFGQDRPPRSGDAVLYRDQRQVTCIGRLVATFGESLELDLIKGRVRRSGTESWYPAPDQVLDRLPLQEGQLLVLVENPLRREAGAILSPGQVLARVFGVLPF